VRERRGGKQRIVARVDRASPVMLESLAFGEILELTALAYELEVSEVWCCHMASN
jgi:hypothetical protein